MAARSPGGESAQVSPPGFHAAIFFGVTHDGLRTVIYHIFTLPLKITDTAKFKFIRLRALSLSSLKIDGEERKTSKLASVTVSVMRGAGEPLPRVTLARLLVLRSSPQIFEEKRECSQSDKFNDRILKQSMPMAENAKQVSARA